MREDEDGTYKISLRSNDTVNVSDIAEVFDGGGHDRAAGCTSDLSFDVTVKKLVKEATKRLWMVY